MLCLQQGVQKAQREQQLTVFAQALAAGLHCRVGGSPSSLPFQAYF